MSSVILAYWLGFFASNTRRWNVIIQVLSCFAVKQERINTSALPLYLLFSILCMVGFICCHQRSLHVVDPVNMANFTACWAETVCEKNGNLVFMSLKQGTNSSPRRGSNPWRTLVSYTGRRSDPQATELQGLAHLPAGSYVTRIFHTVRIRAMSKASRVYVLFLDVVLKFDTLIKLRCKISAIKTFVVVPKTHNTAATPATRMLPNKTIAQHVSYKSRNIS